MCHTLFDPEVWWVLDGVVLGATDHRSEQLAHIRLFPFSDLNNEPLHVVSEPFVLTSMCSEDAQTFI